MISTRRDFLLGLTSTLAVTSVGLASDNGLPIAFSTLACPAWGWGQILEFAAAHGFAAIELRGLQGNLDLPSHPIFASQRLVQTKKEIAVRGLRIACVSSSAHMDEPAGPKRSRQMSDAQRFVDLAASLDSPYVRVFGTNPDNDKSSAPSDATKATVADSLRELGDYAAQRNVTVLIESHDNLVTSPVLGDVLTRANSPHVALLWDAHHTFAEGKEAPEYTVSQLGKWIRHTHLKDSVLAGAERKYVLTGRGDGPIQRQIAELRKIGYQGYFCFEWEKVWHPELTDPEIAVADYARVVSGYLREGK